MAGSPHTIGFDPDMYSRFVNASGALDAPYTGSQFHGPGPATDDWLVDVAIPLSTFTSTTGWESGIRWGSRSRPLRRTPSTTRTGRTMRAGAIPPWFPLPAP